MQQEYEILAEKTLLCLTDHDATARKSVDGLDVQKLGCSSHGFQLPPKHLLQPSSSSSFESTSSSPSSSEEQSEEEQEEPAPSGLGHGDGKKEDAKEDDEGNAKKVSIAEKKDPERFRLQAEAEPIFKRCREIVKLIKRCRSLLPGMVMTKLITCSSLSLKMLRASYATSLR